jgi:hypothetical protein
MKAYAWLMDASSKDAVVKILREDGVLLVEVVKNGCNEAEKFIRRYLPKGCNEITWLGFNPWIDENFQRYVVEYEAIHNCSFEGKV